MKRLTFIYSTMPNPNNMTKQMKESLENLRSSLLCPLCNHLMVNCHNLGCGHSFCNVCIKDYTADNWNCPGESLDFHPRLRV